MARPDRAQRLAENLEGRGIGLAGANADRMVEVDDEDLAVADLAGLGGRGDGIDGLVDGVSAVDVDLNAGGDSRVTVTSAAPLPVEEVREAVDEAGYTLAS